jgi:hypothetical protein
VPEKERPTIQSEKMMVAIMWNPTGFHVINVCGKGCKFNATHYTTEVLSALEEWHRNQIGAFDRKSIVHADDPHRSRYESL